LLVLPHTADPTVRIALGVRAGRTIRNPRTTLASNADDDAIFYA